MQPKLIDQTLNLQLQALKRRRSFIYFCACLVLCQLSFPRTAEGKNLPLTMRLTNTSHVHTQMSRNHTAWWKKYSKVKDGALREVIEMNAKTSTKGNMCLVCRTPSNQTLHQQAADKVLVHKRPHETHCTSQK